MSVLKGTVRQLQSATQGVYPNVPGGGGATPGGALVTLPDGEYELTNITVVGDGIQFLGSQMAHTNSSGIDAGATAIIGTDSMAIGVGATAFGSDSVTIGANTQNLADTSICIGNASTVTAGSNRKIVIGDSTTTASGVDGIAIGTNVTAGPGTDGVAIGNESFAQGIAGVALGYDATANYGSGGPFTVGSNIAIGNAAIGGSSVLFESIAIGRDSRAFSTRCVCIGRTADGETQGGICIGQDATILPTFVDMFSVAIGHSANADDYYDVAFGRNASIAVGVDEACALGTNASVTSSNCVALGHNATAGNWVLNTTAPIGLGIPVAAIQAGDVTGAAAVDYLRLRVVDNLGTPVNLTIPLYADQ